MIEVAAIGSDRQVSLIHWPVQKMTVLDGSLCLLTDDGDTMLAAYADGTWQTARVMGEDEL